MFGIHDEFLQHLKFQWGACEQTRADMTAATPAALKFISDMKALSRDIEAADPGCKQRFSESTGKESRGKALVARMQTLIENAGQADQRCGEQPGWRSAYAGSIGALGAI